MALDNKDLEAIKRLLEPIQADLAAVKQDIRVIKEDLRIIARINQLDEIRKEPRLRALYAAEDQL